LQCHCSGSTHAAYLENGAVTNLAGSAAFISSQVFGIGINGPDVYYAAALAKLQQQNMRLQNLKLSAESQVGGLQKTIDKLRTLQYLWWVLIVLALILGYWLGHHKG